MTSRPDAKFNLSSGHRQGALQLDNITFSYRKGGPVLNQVTFTVDQGPVAILGPNGAGKSTLIGLLTGAMLPSSGDMSVAGIPMCSRSHRRQVQLRSGLMPQHLTMFAHYTAVEFLEYVAWLKKVPKQHVKTNVDWALSTVALTSRASSQIRHMSGGMRQRLGLAQAIVNRPTILVLDEPTVGLDPQQRVEFRNFLVQLRQQALIVMATHLVEDVAAIATHVIVLADGVTLFSGSVRELVGTSGGSQVTGEGVERAYLHTLVSPHAGMRRVSGTELRG